MSTLHQESSDHRALAGLRGQSILITGANGMLGRSFVEALTVIDEGIELHPYSHETLDVSDRAAVLRCVRDHPDLILHCAGMSLADQCEREPQRAHASHVVGTDNIGRLARAVGARVFYPQSVFIFDGDELPVTESTAPNPGLVYGRVKREAERALLEGVPGTLSVRMAGFFGGDAKDKNFVGQFTRHLAQLRGKGVTTCEVGDRSWQPTYTMDLAHNTLLLIALNREGVYHMGAIGEATFFEVASACIEELGLTGRVELHPAPVGIFDGVEPARRPKRMVTANRRLDDEGLNRQRPWRDALHEYLARPHFDQLRHEGAGS